MFNFVIILVFLTSIIIITAAWSSRAFTYQNSDSTDANGDCCDFGVFSCGGCDNEFDFCLRSSSTANDGNSNNCPLGRYSTGYSGDDSFTFGTATLASGVPNPMTFSGSVWPVRVLHSMIVESLVICMSVSSLCSCE